MFTPRPPSASTSRPYIGIDQCKQLFLIGYLLYAPSQSCPEDALFALVTSRFGWGIHDQTRNSTCTTKYFQGHLQWSFVYEFRLAYNSSSDFLSDGRPNSTLALLPTPLASARSTAIHHLSSLSQQRRFGITIPPYCSQSRLCTSKPPPHQFEFIPFCLFSNTSSSVITE